jgi:hypothetical protein
MKINTGSICNHNTFSTAQLRQNAIECRILCDKSCLILYLDSRRCALEMALKVSISEDHHSFRHAADYRVQIVRLLLCAKADATKRHG